MGDKTLNDLFYEQLKDIYYAERKILKALPKMARGAQAEDLKAAFKKHQEETQGHVERLQEVFEILGKRATGKTCPAIDGILEEGDEALDEFKGQPALDAALVAAAQAVEHYEIARYGTLPALGRDARHDGRGEASLGHARRGVGHGRGAFRTCRVRAPTSARSRPDRAAGGRYGLPIEALPGRATEPGVISGAATGACFRCRPPRRRRRSPG